MDNTSKINSLLVTINSDEKLSLKGYFVAQLFGLCPTVRYFYVFRNTERFQEKWMQNKVELATSTSGIFAYYLLMMLKSPKDLRDGLIRRLFHKTSEKVLINEGFLSTLAQTLNQYFAKSSRTDSFVKLLRKTNLRKVILIDEFVSLNFVNLKMLNKFGPIIYVSQDYAYNHFKFAHSFIARKLIYKLEKEAIDLADVVIACSEMERLKYLEMGAKKAVFYPNIYPIKEFEPSDKDQIPSVSIVLPKHWGSRAEDSLKEIFKALSHIDKKIKVYMIGMKPLEVPQNVDLQYYEFIKNKLDYLKTLSKSWIGINTGLHLGGTNEKKYDCAMAGVVVLSDTLGVRGDLLQNEYAYVDRQDLTAKLGQLLGFGRDKIVEMGTQNRVQILSLAEKQRGEVSEVVASLVSI
jgi:hypothetical protein